jgi:hypothetical protein
MSRGLGRVAAELLSIFLKESAHFHPTSELCKRVYRITNVEKKHRVAVLRAMQTLVERQAKLAHCFCIETPQGAFYSSRIDCADGGLSSGYC